MPQRRFLAEGALVAAAFLYGSTFVVVQDAVKDLTPMAFLGMRFGLGALALLPWTIITLRREPVLAKGLLWRVGLATGLLLFVGYVTQTVGLQYTSSSSSAFITGLYVVFTPIVEAIVRRHVPPTSVIVGTGVATGGLFMLTGAHLDIGRGEALTLACAVAFALWIVVQGTYAREFHPAPFTAVQLVVVAVLAAPATALTGFGDLTGYALLAIVFTGVACSAGALSLQLFGQRRVGPSRSALILLLEPVFAGLIGYSIGERLGAMRLAGAAVILAGIAIAELAPSASRDDDGDPFAWDDASREHSGIPDRR